MTFRVIIAVEVGDPKIVLDETIRMYVEGLRAIGGKLEQYEVLVCPFASAWIVGFSDCVISAQSQLMQFDAGCFDVNSFEEMVVRWCATDSVLGLGLSFQTVWKSLRNHALKDTDRVVVIARSTFTIGSQLGIGGIVPVCPICFVVFGETEATHQSHTAMHGGFLFPNVSDIASAREIMATGVRAFLDLSDEDVTARRSQCIYSETTPSREQFAISLSPGQHLRKALIRDSSDLSFRWTTGIREVRETWIGVRDVVCCEATSLGLELSPPEGSSYWRVLCTHPPISGLGIEEGSVLISINGNPVSRDRRTTIAAMSERPLVASLVAPNNRKHHEHTVWVNSVAEEICAYVNNLRAVSRKSLEPKPFPSDVANPPWPNQNHDPPSWPRLQDHPIYIPTTYRKFVKLVSAVLPACLVHAPDITQKLYSEGFPFEYSFIRMILTPVSSQVSAIYAEDGILSIWWLRIFLALLTDLKLDVHSRGILDPCIVSLHENRISPELLVSCASISITEKWVDEWTTYENLFS